MYQMIFKQRFLQRTRNGFKFFMECFDALLQIAVLFCLYRAVFGSREYINNNSFAQVMTGIAVAVMIEELAYINGAKLANMVNRGKMSYELLKPYSFPIKAITEAAADFCAGIIWKLIPMFVAIALTMGLSIPKSFIHAGLFFISALLGVFILWGIQMTLQMFGFWFRNMLNVFMMMSTVYKLLGGMFISYCFFPKILTQILMCTPFAYIWHIPMEIYFGRISGGFIMLGLLMQIVWTLILGILIKYLYKRGKTSLQMSD